MFLWGDSLCGRSYDLTCYDNEGYVDYEKVKMKESKIIMKPIDQLLIDPDNSWSIGRRDYKFVPEDQILDTRVQKRYYILL